MKINCLIKDKKMIKEELEKRLNLKAEYLGAPTFAYKIGPYILNHNLTIFVRDEEADIEMLREMNTNGLIDNAWDNSVNDLEITLPAEKHDGKTLTNLVRIFYSRGKIINKSIGYSKAFNISEIFIQKLDEKRPETKEEFLEILNKCGGNSINSGIEFSDKCIKFTGFQLSEDADKNKAYLNLAALVNDAALKQKHININKHEISNEKYYFRVWLIRLGMKGDDYKSTRQILLKNLTGNSAFRTEEQKEAAREKYTKK